jgi:tRNA/tmRNA/rRNA uracil-C5-methylase (TrmA/RlmC/RlmD family)
VELYEELIGLATVNGLVVDLFAGSGSAGVAAVRRGCSYAGAELVPAYAEIANERIAMAAGEVAHVVDAVNFFLQDATLEQFMAITLPLRKAGLACAHRIMKGVAARTPRSPTWGGRNVPCPH